MSKDYQVIAKKTAKVAGALAMGTGIVALSAVVASGAALGAVVEGFKSAGDAVKKSLANNEQNDSEQKMEMANNEQAAQEIVETEKVESESVENV